jgi:hypothetical protein
VLGVEGLWLSTGKGPKRTEGTSTYLDHGIPPEVLALAQKLALVPDEKLKAVSILLGLNLSENAYDWGREVAHRVTLRCFKTA